MLTTPLELDSDLIAALGQAELFGGIAPNDLRTLTMGAALAHFDAEEFLLVAGVLNTSIYVVLDGNVEVLRFTGQTTEVIARLGAGSCQGEMSALTGHPAGVSVRAVSPTRVIVFDKEALLAGLERISKLGANLAGVMMGRLQGHLGRRVARTVLLLLDPSVERELAAVRALLLRVAHYARRTVIADLTDRIGLIRARGLPSFTELASNPSRSADILRDLASGRDLFWTVRPGPSLIDARQVFGLLGVFDAYCDQVVLVADRGRASELMAHGADYLEGLVWVTQASSPALVAPLPLRAKPGEPAPDPRVLVPDLLVPDTMGAAGEIDRQFGGKVFSSTGVITDSRGIDALARDITGQRLGIALGAGAARGFAHIGVLERMTELGVPIDAMAGSSAGAGIGCMWSVGYPADRILDLFSQLEKHAVRWTLPFRSILSGKALERFMRHATDGNGFHEARQPFGIVVVDLYAAKEELFTGGDMVSCVLASSAIPGVYPPIKLGSRWYVDGGVLNPVPTAFVRPLGADRVIAVDLAATATEPEAPPPRGPHLLDVLRHSANLMHARLTEHSRAGADLILRPDAGIGPAPGFKDYNKAREWHRYGREAVDRAWPDICDLLPWLEPRRRAGAT